MKDPKLKAVPLTVYVVMGNDYPAAVFLDEGDAERYCKRNNAESEASGGQRIYWRHYDFELMPKQK